MGVVFNLIYNTLQDSLKSLLVQILSNSDECLCVCGLVVDKAPQIMLQLRSSNVIVNVAPSKDANASPSLLLCGQYIITNRGNHSKPFQSVKLNI